MVRTAKNRIPLLAAIALALALLLGLVALFESGWRIGRGGLTRIVRGQVCVRAPLPASELYVDQDRIETSRAANKELCALLAPGEHTLLLAAPGTVPWFKKITVPARRSYHAFTLAQKIPPTTLTPGTDQYTVAQNMLVTTILPDRGSPLRSADAALAVWFDGETSELRAEWRGDETTLPPGFCEERECANMITLLSNVTDPPRALTLAPGRDDIVLIATGTGVYALEITSALAPNFQPIYSGIAPTFVLRDATSIYVGDGSTLFMLTLDAGL